MIKILHNLNNLGGTLLCPMNKVGCLIGTDPTAIPIIVDHQASLCSIQAILPSITVNNLAALPIPPADDGGRVNLEVLRSFFLAPFLRNTILAMQSPTPLALILKGRAAQEEHIREHGGDEGFDKGGINDHVKLFHLWCTGVHQGQVKEMCFPIAQTTENSWSGTPASTAITSCQVSRPRPPLPLP
jgi:hypothetical protein